MSGDRLVKGSHMLEGSAYSVHMDLDAFRDLFRAQQIRYTRKLGILCAALFGLLALVSVFASLTAPSVEMEGTALLFVVLLAFGVMMAVRPPLLLATRAGLVRRWFAQRGAANAASDPLAQLVADYTVTLSAFGFTEASSTATLNVPWFALDARPVAGDNGTYFVLAKGKEASLAYNLMGINWAFRDEDASGVLFLPREVVEKSPGLVDEVSSAIKGARQRYLGRGRQAGEDERLAAWLAAR